MSVEKFEEDLARITKRIGLMAYFMKIFKLELEQKSSKEGTKLSKEEMASFWCSGIVQIIDNWVNEFVKEGTDPVDLETFKKTIDKKLSTYYYI